MDHAAKWVRAASAADLGEGEMMSVDLEGRQIALYHLDDGSWHATDAVCTHAFALLTDGWLDGNEIECPLHAGRFDVRTGQGVCAPIDRDLTVYPVRLDGGDILVGFPG